MVSGAAFFACSHTGFLFWSCSCFFAYKHGSPQVISMSWILLLDVGNTNLKLTLADSQGFKRVIKLPSEIRETSDSLGLKLVQYCSLQKVNLQSIRAWIVSSVVPMLDSTIAVACREFCGCPCYFVPADLKVPVNNLYQRPSEVGSDRLITAYAARRLYQTRALIIIDFGTATTFDCMTEDNYLGGLICPGLHSSIRALSTQTAKLPQFCLEYASQDLELGRSTVQSLSQGTLFGFADMVEGLSSRLKNKLGPPVTVIGTGGVVEKLARFCPSMNEVRPDLLLTGLSLLARDHNLFDR